MKTKEELNALEEEVEALNKKLTELTEEELEQVTGGLSSDSLLLPSSTSIGEFALETDGRLKPRLRALPQADSTSM